MRAAMDTRPTDAGQETLFGHPRGLAYIVFTEAWERFSFYGMQGLLVLYLSGYLFQPAHVGSVIGMGAYRTAVEAVFGQLSVAALATQTFGLYAGSVYFTPILGGWLGDRWLGRTRAVTLGAAIMVAGHLLMALESALLPALLALLVGCGLLKGNLAAQVGALYPRDDPRRDRAFSVYYLGVNFGAFVAPLVCGTLGEVYGWHYGFTVAGLGMALGLLVYLAGRRHLPADPLGHKAERVRLDPAERGAVLGLVIVLALVTLFWIAQTQVWNSYPLWLQGRLDRAAFGLTVPITWFQSLDALLVLAMAPLLMALWRRQERDGGGQGDLAKVRTGCLVFAGACLWLVLGEFVSGGARVALVWPLLFHLTCAVGYLYVTPITLALFARAAPVAINAMTVSAFYLAIFFGSIASGWLGRFLEVLSPAAFWGMHAAIVGCGGLLLFILERPLLRLLRIPSHQGR